MKKNLRHWAAAAVGAAAALAFTSCTYDPNYSSVGGWYSSGYGHGYGYGGSHFDTSVFVSTGNPRWGYDPYCYSYYDYQRHSYYDPYLNGYYPVGYRPAYVVGCPHPYGWRPGSGYCPPPRYVSNVTVRNYSNREINYRNSSYSWAHQVHQQSYNPGRVTSQRPDHNSYNNRPVTGTRPPVYGSSNHGSYSSNNSHGAYGNSQSQSRNQSGYNHSTRSGSSPQYQKPADYSKYVNHKTPTQGRYDSRGSQGNNQPRTGGKQMKPTPPQKGGNPNRQQGSRPASKDDKNKLRSLGQG